MTTYAVPPPEDSHARRPARKAVSAEARARAIDAVQADTRYPGVVIQQAVAANC